MSTVSINNDPNKESRVNNQQFQRGDLESHNWDLEDLPLYEIDEAYTFCHQV